MPQISVTLNVPTTRVGDYVATFLASAERGGRIDENLTDNENALKEWRHLVRNMTKQRVVSYLEDQQTVSEPDITDASA